MKKIRNVVLIFALLLSFNGCEKNPVDEDLLSNNDELTVDQAKAFIDAQRFNQFTLKGGGMQKHTISIRADWTKVKSSKNEKISVVETEIQALGRFGFATPESMQASKSTNNKAYIYSMTRLVVIKHKKSGEMYSFIMSIAGDKQYLDNKKFNLWDNTYLKRDKDLSGIVLFHRISGEFVNGWIYCDGQITNSIIATDNMDLPIQLKSAAVMLVVYEWVETCTDLYTLGWVNGELVSITYTGESCSSSSVYVGTYETGTSSGTTESNGGGTLGGYEPTPTQPCNCPDVCPVCSKCLDVKLKSVPIPDDGTTTTPTTDPCVYCSGHPVAIPTPSELFFDNIDKINMDSPTLLQEISCLIRNLAKSDSKLLTSDVIEGIGDRYISGYNIGQTNFNYQGHNVKIVVVYDEINVMNHIGKRTESQGSQVILHEIYVKAKMNSTGEKPNLILLQFEPQDLDFLNSIWKHIKGETNLWNCN